MGDPFKQNKVKISISAFEKLFHEKVRSVRARIDAERFSAPASYISDMEGYHRGLVEMGNNAIEHFKKQLLGL